MARDGRALASAWSTNSCATAFVRRGNLLLHNIHNRHGVVGARTDLPLRIPRLCVLVVLPAFLVVPHRPCQRGCVGPGQLPNHDVRGV